MPETSISFEEAMLRLEDIVKQLEQGEVPLEKSMALFTEGTKLVGTCNKLLDEAELTVTQLTKGPEGAPVETEFSHESE